MKGSYYIIIITIIIIEYSYSIASNTLLPERH